MCSGPKGRKREGEAEGYKGKCAPLNILVGRLPSNSEQEEK